MPDLAIKGLSQDELDHIAETLNRKHRSHLSDPVYKTRFFQVAAQRDSRGVYAKITLQNQDQSFYYPVESRLADIDHDLSAKDAVFFLFDYIDAYWDEYFQNPDVFLPIDWTEYEYDGIPFQLKGQILNLRLERLGDRLIGEGAAASGESAPLGSF